MTLNKKLKVVFIGCLESSERLLNNLLTRCSGFGKVVGIVTKSIRISNADFAELLSIASAHNIPVFDYSSATNNCLDVELVSSIRNKEAEVCYLRI